MAIIGDRLIKILYADDDVDDLELFREALKVAHSNANLQTAEDGEELMKYLEQYNYLLPDIIFLDINMPCKNGKECLEEIRSNPKFSKIPVVMFSTSSYNEDIEETFEKGANLYVSKPLFYEDEIKILDKIFSLDWTEELLKPDKKRFVIYTAEIQ